MNVKTASPFKNRNIISMKDFSKEDILSVLDHADALKKYPQPDLMKGKLLASCFFEPSTRTRLSFEAAMKRMGGDVIGFSEASSTSASKKESLYDTIKVVGQYADIVVLRHPQEGAAHEAAQATDKPIINAGDGANQHPTQALLDLFSIKECQQKLEGLHIAFAGDLLHARTIHSLVQACSLFNMRLYFVPRQGLELPKYMYDELKQNRVLFSIHPSLQEILPNLDIVYLTRVQLERMEQKGEARQKDEYLVNLANLARAKPTLRILHPLPRVAEIDPEVDKTPYAYYFNQSQNGLYLRQALLNMILGD